MQKTIIYPRPATWIGWGLVLLLGGALAGYLGEVYTDLDYYLFAENGPVEGSQTIVLGVAAAIFAARGWRSKGPVAFLCIAVVYVLLHAMVRETPRCDSPFYPGGICLTRTAKEALWVIFTVGLAALLFLKRADFLDALKPRWSFVFWPLGVAFIMLLAGELAEHYNQEGIEETLEMLAYCYTLACSIWIYRHT